MNDILYVNGLIYTADAGRSTAEAAAVKDGRFTFVGSNAAAEAVEAAQTVDLKGKMMIPGFIEGHGHVTWAGIDHLFKINMFAAESIQDYLDIIRKAVEEHPEYTVYEGVGWENPYFGTHGPSRKMLDEICSDRPMIMTSGDKHSIWVNTYVLEKCGIDGNTQVPEGNVIEKDENGVPTGTLREFAAIALADPVRAVYTKENYKDAVRWVQKKLSKYGVTSMLDPVLDPDDKAIEAIKELNEEGGLVCKMRGAFRTSESDPFRYIEDYERIRAEVASHMFRIDQVKIFADGVVEGKTAFMKEPYEGGEFRGYPVWDADLLKRFCIKADSMGFDIHVHSIGDAALAMTLDTLDAVREACPERKRRPVITHLQIVDPEDIPRMKDHNVVALTNPYWHFRIKGFFDAIEYPYLGERALHEYPMKSLADAGLILGGASDFNVTPVPAPLRAIQIGARRIGLREQSSDPSIILGPEERMSVEDLVRIFTIGNAYALGMEDITGSIEKGKCADFAILEENIFEVPVERLFRTKVVQTVSEGRIIYEA